jgi:hypothetical protein
VNSEISIEFPWIFHFQQNIHNYGNFHQSGNPAIPCAFDLISKRTYITPYNKKKLNTDFDCSGKYQISHSPHCQSASYYHYSICFGLITCYSKYFWKDNGWVANQNVITNMLRSCFLVCTFVHSLTIAGELLSKFLCWNTPQNIEKHKKWSKCITLLKHKYIF